MIRFSALLFTLFCAASTLHAEDKQSGDFKYTSDGSAITITKYTGSGGKIAIPEKIENLPVRTIGKAAFALNDGEGTEESKQRMKMITGITIPASITTIENHAFAESHGLTSIIIPASVTSMGDAVFFSCPNLAKVTISPGITSIGSSTFRFCGNLSTVTIPASVTSIGKDAFKGCEKLTAVTLPPKLTNIGLDAFNLTGLTTVTIPSGVTIIGDFAFGRCSNLASVTFQGNAPTMGDNGPFGHNAADFTIRFYKGSTGFTTPEWKGHKTVEIDSTTKG